MSNHYTLPISVWQNHRDQMAGNIINMFIVLLPVVAWTTADHPKPHSKLCLLYSRPFNRISKSYVKFSVTKLHDINHDLGAKFGLGSGSQAVYVVDTVVFTYSFNIADGIWLKYRQCCVKHYPINRLTCLRQFRWKLKIYRQDKRMESCWHFLLRGKEYIVSQSYFLGDPSSHNKLFKKTSYGK